MFVKCTQCKTTVTMRQHISIEDFLCFRSYNKIQKVLIDCSVVRRLNGKIQVYYCFKLSSHSSKNKNVEEIEMIHLVSVDFFLGETTIRSPQFMHCSVWDERVCVSLKKDTKQSMKIKNHSCLRRLFLFEFNLKYKQQMKPIRNCERNSDRKF